MWLLVAGSDDREYINFCEGRPDVYYLHQRLHARPDLLHLIKSNEYIEEKATSDATDSIAHDPSAGVPLVGGGGSIGGNSASPGASVAALRTGHKRFKRIVPAPTGTASVYGHSAASANGGGGASGSHSTNNTNTTSNATMSSNGGGTSAAGGSASANLSGPRRSSAREYLAIPSNASPGVEDGSGSGGNGGSTENSETTGEESSVGKKSNTSSESQIREVLVEQKYFGLLLQNFEAIFESLHNKKVLLAALRKDPNAPDHLISDLHDDIHVLSSLKKEFRNKLRSTLA